MTSVRSFCPLLPTRCASLQQRVKLIRMLMLALPILQASVFWQRMRQMQEENMTVQVKVESANRGGLLVKYGPYEGFVPVSQFGPVSGQTVLPPAGSSLCLWERV